MTNDAGDGADRGPRPTAGERLAAIVALVSLVGAVTAIVVSTAASWEGVAITVVGLFVIVVAGWYAVSRRGLARSIAAGFGVAGAGVVIAGFVVADVSALRVAVVSLLAALSVGTARFALRRSPRVLRRRARSRTTVPAAQNPVLIINPRSGGASAARHNLVDECRARGIEPIVLQPGDDMLQLAERAIAGGADVIGVAGGDGSQALVATVAMRHDIAHVVVPAGTRNHFALDLGLDRQDVVGALDAYVDGVERHVDVAAVNGRIFVNNASVGVYAAVVQSPSYRDAKASTVVETLPDLVGPDAVPLDLRFAGPDGTVHPTAHVIMVSNDPYQLHMVAGRGTRERLDRGELGIVALQVPTAGALSRFLALLATGRAQRFSGWVEWTASEFRIDSDAPVAIGVDGEALVLEPPLVFETKPAALRVRLPRHAVGRSPTAMAAHVVSRSTMVQLVRLAAGRPSEDER